jgi:phasin family protein
MSGSKTKIIESAAAATIAEQERAAAQERQERAVQNATRGVSQSVAQGSAQVLETQARAADRVTANISATTATFQQGSEKVKETMEKAMKTAEELVSFGQGNLEAFVTSSQIWAAGVQDLSKHMATSAQAAMEEGMSTFRALAGVKSLKEAVELQTGLARTTIEKTLAESGKLTEASMKIAEQAFAPIAARVTLAVEKFGADKTGMMERFTRAA